MRKPQVKTAKHIKDEALTVPQVMMVRAAALATLALVVQSGVDSIATVAKKLWVSEPAIHHWLAGKNGMTMDHARTILSLYDFPRAREIQEALK